MKLENKKRWKPFYVVAVAFLFVTSAVFLIYLFQRKGPLEISPPQENEILSQVSEETVSSEAVATSEVEKKGLTKVYVSGMIEYMSEEDLVENSTLIIRGTVTGQSDSFEIMAVTGGISTYTDYYVEVTQVLRGSSAKAGDTVNIRMEGGEVDGIETIVDYMPPLEISDEMILYLKRPGRGGGFNTEGDYYYIVGSCQGAYILDKSNKERTGIEKFATIDGETYAFNEAVEEISTFSEKYPVNENLSQDKFLKNLKGNLKTGYITQEEYDCYLAESKEYATIIE